MKTLNMATNPSYDIMVGAGILPGIGKVIKKKFGNVKIAVITDDIVATFYEKMLTSALEEQGYTAATFVFPNGEASKNLSTYENILDFLAGQQLTRSDLIIALGGGVVGDITGFAAATYLRGIRYLQIPTTLLAAVDSSVGGKTAVNLCNGKNLVGAFYQPALVYCDYTTMETMEKDRFADGIAEAIKYGVLADAQLFELLAKGEICQHMEEVILTCLKIKCDLVMADEFDKGQRQMLNLGHTIGHAIERESGYTITHGHAVAIGMAMIAKISDKQGLSDCNCEAPIIEALKHNDLPFTAPYPIEQLVKAMLQDKKCHGDSLTFILPKAIGACVLYPVPLRALEKFLVTESSYEN